VPFVRAHLLCGHDTTSEKLAAKCWRRTSSESVKAGTIGRTAGPRIIAVARRPSCAATIKVALDQPPKQFVDLDAMVADRLRDVRAANLFLGSIRQGGTRQIAFGQRAESTSVHRHPLP